MAPLKKAGFSKKTLDYYTNYLNKKWSKWDTDGNGTVSLNEL
jgi:hypothetical protein